MVVLLIFGTFLSQTNIKEKFRLLFIKFGYLVEESGIDEVYKKSIYKQNLELFETIIWALNDIEIKKNSENYLNSLKRKE